jgi:hypothetical protein
MQTVTLLQLNERLKLLPPDKLAVVYDFVAYLSERELRLVLKDKPSEAYQTMIASEAALSRDWDRPEEDQAWAELATDPVLKFGVQPIADELTDASVNHDRYLYGAP